MAAGRLSSEGRAIRVLVSVAVVAIVATVAGYLLLIRSQGDLPPDVVTVPFVASYQVLMAGLLLVSLIETPFVRILRPALRAAPSAGLLLLGFLAMFSIGVAVVIAAALALAATVITISARPTRAALLSAAAAAVVAVAVLIAGLQFSWSHIVCPDSGQMGGSTAGFFGSTSYECNNGQLTFTGS